MQKKFSGIKYLNDSIIEFLKGYKPVCRPGSKAFNRLSPHEKVQMIERIKAAEQQYRIRWNQPLFE